MDTKLFVRQQSGGMFSILDRETFPTGSIWWVGSTVTGATNGTGYGRNPDAPFATLAYAVTQAAAGDTIFLLPSHAETVAAAAGINLNKAGLRVIGLGAGATRPTFSFSATASTITITAASIEVANIIVKATIDSVVSPLVVSAANVSLDYESQDTSDAVEMVRSLLTTAAADNLKVKVTHRGFIAGDAGVNAIRLVGADNADVDIHYYGKASTAAVEFHTTACHNVNVRGYVYNESAALTKNVVDTATGSTWSGDIFDGKHGSHISGGSAQAGLAADDVGAVAALHNVPTANAATNATVRDVVGNKTDTAVSTVGTEKTVMAYTKGLLGTAGAVADSAQHTVAADKTIMAYAKGILTDTIQIADGTLPAEPVAGSLARYIASGGTALGTPLGDSKSLVDALGTDGVAVTDSAVTVLGAIGANNSNNAYDSGNVVANASGSVLERQEYLQGLHAVPTVNGTVDANMRDVIGKKNDAAVAAVGTENSIVAYTKGVLNDTVTLKQLIQSSATKSTTSAATADLFTVSGGPVKILNIFGVITTTHEAAGNNTKLVHTATAGGATDLCSALDLTGAAEHKILSIDGTFANALILSATLGAKAGVQAAPAILTVGTISMNCSATTTGAVTWYVEYQPLVAGAAIAAA